MAALHVAGVRGNPCGAVHWTGRCMCWCLSIIELKNARCNIEIIHTIFRQPLHVPGVSRLIIRRYNHMYTTFGTYYSFWMTACCPSCSIQPGQQSSKKNNKYHLLYTYGCTS